LSKSSASKWTSDRNPALSRPHSPGRPGHLGPQRGSPGTLPARAPSRPSRPHPPAWCRPSRGPGAARPAGPGAAGAAWLGLGTIGRHHGAPRTGNFATGRAGAATHWTRPGGGAPRSSALPAAARGWVFRQSRRSPWPLELGQLPPVQVSPGSFRRSAPSPPFSRGFSTTRRKSGVRKPQFVDPRFCPRPSRYKSPDPWFVHLKSAVSFAQGLMSCTKNSLSDKPQNQLLGLHFH
jgi:hypothetical protein